MASRAVAQFILAGIPDSLSFQARLRHLAAIEVQQRPNVAEHSLGVARVTAALAAELAMPPASIDRLKSAARWHDIGKLAIPSDILGKRDRLTESDFREIRAHAEIGSLLLGDDAPLDFIDVARFHHERYDGHGYNGLKGESIPFAARLVAIADVHDALVSKREYKGSLREEDALMLMIADNPSPDFGRRGFDPHLLRVFVSMRLRDPDLGLSPDNREALATYAASDPMSDFATAENDGWIVHPSGERMLYAADASGSSQLMKTISPIGDVQFECELDAPERDFSMS